MLALAFFQKNVFSQTLPGILHASLLHGTQFGHELRRREKRKLTTDVGGFLRRKFYEGNPGKLRSLAECRSNDEIAHKTQELRTKSGLTQAQLAELAGTTGFGDLPAGRRRLSGVLGGNASPACCRAQPPSGDPLSATHEAGVSVRQLLEARVSR
jgi:hypothetical protein